VGSRVLQMHPGLTLFVEPTKCKALLHRVRPPISLASTFDGSYIGPFVSCRSGGGFNGLRITHKELDSMLSPTGHTSLVQTGTKPALLAAKINVLFRHPEWGIRPTSMKTITNCQVHTTPGCPYSMSCFLLHGSAFHFGKERPHRFGGDKWRLLVPERQRAVLRASHPAYKLPVVNASLLLRSAFVNWIGLAAPAVY
jgi:hypothetical protein